MRAIHDTIFSRWRPQHSSVTHTPEAERPFVEMALRRAADEASSNLEPFFAPSREFAYAETATAAVQARPTELSFEPVLAALTKTREQAMFDLQAVRVEDDVASRWVHLVVWADELADDGYHDPRLHT